MKQWMIAAVLSIGLVFTGCGSSGGSDAEETLHKDSAKFSELDSTYMEIQERHVTNGEKIEIIFCKNGKSQFDSLKNGTFDIASAPTVNMDFTSDGNGTQQITEATHDGEFKVHEYLTVDINNSGTPADYIINKMSETICL